MNNIGCVSERKIRIDSYKIKNNKVNILETTDKGTCTRSIIYDNELVNIDTKLINYLRARIHKFTNLHNDVEFRVLETISDNNITKRRYFINGVLNENKYCTDTELELSFCLTIGVPIIVCE